MLIRPLVRSLEPPIEGPPPAACAIAAPLHAEFDLFPPVRPAGGVLGPQLHVPPERWAVPIVNGELALQVEREEGPGRGEGSAVRAASHPVFPHVEESDGVAGVPEPLGEVPLLQIGGAVGRREGEDGDLLEGG